MILEKRFLILFFLLVALSETSQMPAQSDRGLLRGRITNENGDGLSNAEIQLTKERTGQQRSSISGINGEYVLSQLSPGDYQLEVRLTDYKKHLQKIYLRINHEFRLDISLQLGPPHEQIIVTSSSGLLGKNSATLSTVINNRFIDEFPLDGRNFFELSLLTPGAVPAAPGSPGSVRGDFAFSVNGGRESSNNFLLDGAYNSDPKLNGPAIKPPVDAIREFEILSNNYDASFGRNGGSQVNVLLKTGSNSLHGTVYEFHRNGALDARNFFAPSQEAAPPYQRNQFGFSLGGNIVKNQTFFFADYEGYRLREGITRVTNVPTIQERSGDFSQSLFPKPADPSTQQSFPEGKIPTGYLSTVGLAVANLYPEPNRLTPFQNFVSSPSLKDRNDQADFRLDHLLTQYSELFFRFSISDRDLFEPFSSSNFSLLPGFGNNVPRRAQNIMLGSSVVVTPTLTNQARLSFTRVAGGVFQENMGDSINPSVGLPELSDNPRDHGLPFITISGFSPLGAEYNNPQQSATNVFHVSDNTSYSHGSHLLKFGFNFRSVQQNAFRDIQSRGFLTFSDQAGISSNALADLLLGLPLLSGGARLDNHQHLRTKSYGFFIQDNYHLARDLTISAGIRYEHNSPPVDKEDRANIYDPKTQSLVQVGTQTIPRSGYQSDRNNWAPRLGLAWALGNTKNSVLRTGYGLYFDQSPLATGEGLYFNAPFFDMKLFFPFPGLPLRIENPFPSNFPVSLPSSALSIQNNLRTAYIQHWNLSLQHELSQNRILEISYVGSKGTKLLTARDVNQPRPKAQLPNPRPVVQFDDINMIESRASSTYHGLQIRFHQHLMSGFSVLSSYTFSKSLDDSSNFFSSTGDPNFPQDSLNIRAERGLSNFDVRHRVSISYSYHFPIGKGHAVLGNQGWLSKILENWQTTGVITVQSGRPFTVALLPEIDNSNTGRSMLGFGANDRPNLNTNPRLSNPQNDTWFNTSAFTVPPTGNFGNSGRNILGGPGFQNFNASLIKNTALSGDLKLQFRMEAFNILNHVNFDLPGIFLGSPTFGRILSAQSPRHLQLGLKLLF